MMRPVVHGTAGQVYLGAESASIRPLRNQHFLPGVKADATFRRGNIAVVLNFLRDEESGAAAPDVELAIVDDAGLRRRAVELPEKPGTGFHRGDGRCGNNQTGGPK